MGLPGAGKTTLARELAARLNAPLWDADDVRENVCQDLGFSPEDRVEQARRMAWLCSRVPGDSIAAFVCPTEQTRKIFGADCTIWVDRIKAGRFADTNAMFEPPLHADFRLSDGSVTDWADRVLA